MENQQYPILVKLLPFLEAYPGIISYHIKQKNSKKEAVNVFKTEEMLAKGANSVFTLTNSGDIIQLSCTTVPSSSSGCQIQLPSGFLCTFLVFGSCKVILLFLIKLTQRTSRERRDIFLVLQVDKMETEVESTDNPCCAHIRVAVPRGQKTHEFQTIALCYQGQGFAGFQDHSLCGTRVVLIESPCSAVG